MNLLQYVAREISNILSLILVLIIVISGLLICGAGIWGWGPLKNFWRTIRSVCTGLAIWLLKLPFRLIGKILGVKSKKRKKKKKTKSKSWW